MLPNWPQNDSFNSKMVRLKADTQPENSSKNPSFNSKMVRLKEYIEIHLASLHRVSIPKWYD